MPSSSIVALIAAAQLLDLGEQHRGPHMGILPQTLPDKGLDPIKRINLALATTMNTDLAVAVQIRPDRLAVKVGVTGDR